MHEVTLLLGATIDFQSAYERCADEQSADRLEAKLCAALRQLAHHPWSSSEMERGFRRLLVPRTVYGLFYVVEGHRVAVHALLDLRQDPTSIRQRLGL